MADVKVIRHLLANDAALLAIVPAERIMPGVIPQGTALPAIAVSHISTTRRHAVAAGIPELCRSRVQITAMAKSYPQQKQVIALIRDALPRLRGTVQGVVVDNLLYDNDGPDFRDDDAGVYMQTIDYLVTHSA